MLNEKGFTLVELLIAVVILMVVSTATLHFYDSYKYEKSQFGEYVTAKNLAVKALEEQRKYYIEGYEAPVGKVFHTMERVNGINFEVTVTKRDETNNIDNDTDEIKFMKFTSKVQWRLRELEVSTYASER